MRVFRENITRKIESRPVAAVEGWGALAKTIFEANPTLCSTARDLREALRGVDLRLRSDSSYTDAAQELPRHDHCEETQPKLLEIACDSGLGGSTYG